MGLRQAFTGELDSGESRAFSGGRTSANLFALMGVRPILGRTFSGERKTWRAVNVVSHGLWYARFGSLRRSWQESRSGRESDGHCGVCCLRSSSGKGCELMGAVTIFRNWSGLRGQREHSSGFVVEDLNVVFSFSQAQADMT